MKIVKIHKAKIHLSRLVAEAANDKPFIIAKAGRSIVKVVPLDETTDAAFTRVGFLAGQIDFPDDFDRMAQSEIEQMFGVDGA